LKFLLIILDIFVTILLNIQPCGNFRNPETINKFMKNFLSAIQPASAVRICSLACLATTSFSLISCRLPSDPSRSLQTTALFGNGNSSETARTAQSSVPVAESVKGRPGFVYSPHVPNQALVNVAKFSPGQEVRCPYTDKLFRIPEPALEIKGPAAIAYTEVPFRNFALADDFSPTRVPLRPQALKPTDPVAVIKRLGLDVFALDVSNPASDIGPLGSLPFAKNVPGTPGMVYSPFARKSQLVDVAGLMPGVEVTCPYTGKLFRVPAPLPMTAAAR
jgi:hypothetical protein